MVFGSQLSLSCLVCVFNFFAYKDPTEGGRVRQFYFALSCLILSSENDAAIYQELINWVIYIFLVMVVCLVHSGFSLPSFQRSFS